MKQQQERKSVPIMTQKAINDTNKYRKMISGALGHSTVSTTSNIYCHMLEEAQAKVSEAVSAALDFSGSNQEPGGE